MSETMQGLVMDAPGGPEVLQVHEIARPSVERPSDVLVRVRAAGVNPADWHSGPKPVRLHCESKNK